MDPPFRLGFERKPMAHSRQQEKKAPTTKGQMIGRAGLEPPRENKGETLGVGQGVGTSAVEGGEKPDPTLAALLALWPTLKLAKRQSLLRQAQGASEVQEAKPKA